jgi:hypothetical protein
MAADRVLLNYDVRANPPRGGDAKLPISSAVFEAAGLPVQRNVQRAVIHVRLRAVRRQTEPP